MLKRKYEWLRVAIPKPDNATVEARARTVKDLLARIDQANNLEFLGGVVTGAVAGLEGRLPEGSPLVGVLVESISEYQAAFPSDLKDNALELKALCALLTGELLARGQKKGRELERQAAAMLVLTGNSLKPPDEGAHLRTMTSELVEEAATVAQAEAIARRKRPEIDFDALDAVEHQGDAALLSRTLLPILRECFETAEKRARADREELEVLWWLYNAFSEVLRLPISSLTTDVALLACGVEVGDRVLIPPHPGGAAMVAEAVARNRKQTKLAARSLAALVGEWDESARSLLIPCEETSRRFALAFPALLPLTWLAVRLTDSRGSGGWEDEFERKSGILSSHKFEVATLAGQVFRERVTQRLIAEGGGV